MAETQKKEATVAQAIVAHGRSLVIDKEMKSAGESVTLDPAEIKRLQKLGFLVDPDAELAAPIGNGPTFTTTEGVAIRRVV